MVDIATAENHGICPVCEGYGGGKNVYGPDELSCDNELCVGSCPRCWCEGCHDGQLLGIPLPESGELMGSWEAYEALSIYHRALMDSR